MQFLYAWKLLVKKHKKTCKAPTREAASEAELRVLHEDMLLRSHCRKTGSSKGEEI